MEYLIPAALVVLVVAAFVTFVALYSTRKGGPGEIDRNAGDSGDARPGMGADSATALGDTDQLADEAGSESPSPSRFERDTGEDDDRPASERLADRSF